MNLPRLLASFCLLAASILRSPAMAHAQEAPAAPKSTAEHKILAGDGGTWHATIMSFMAGPDAEPMVTKGTEVNTILPGGPCLLSKFGQVHGSG